MIEKIEVINRGALGEANRGTQDKKIDVVHVHGLPGAGKDTQADLLKEVTGALKLSTGDIFRGAQTPDGSFGRYYHILEPYINNGNNGGLIPDKPILYIYENYIQEIIDPDELTSDGLFLIVTGMPRTRDQAIALNEIYSRIPWQFQERHLLYEVSEEVALARIGHRAETDLTPRADDADEEKVRRRFRAYQEETRPMVELLEEQGRLFTINAADSIEGVHQRTRAALCLN